MGVVAESEFHIPIGICVFFYLSNAAQFPCRNVAVTILQVYFSKELCLYYCDDDGGGGGAAAANANVKELSQST